MAAGYRGQKSLIATALLAGVATCALAPMAIVPAQAQTRDIDSLAPNIPPEAKLILAANELVYNKEIGRASCRERVL